MLGVGSGLLTSLAAVGFPPAVLAQFGMLAAVGGTIGSIIGRRITATELPQMVAGQWISLLDLHEQRINPVMCSRSLALCCWSCCCPYFDWKRLGGCWSCIYAPRTNLTFSASSAAH